MVTAGPPTATPSTEAAAGGRRRYGEVGLRGHAVIAGRDGGRGGGADRSGHDREVETARSRRHQNADGHRHRALVAAQPHHDPPVGSGTVQRHRPLRRGASCHAAGIDAHSAHRHRRRQVGHASAQPVIGEAVAPIDAGGADGAPLYGLVDFFRGAQVVLTGGDHLRRVRKGIVRPIQGDVKDREDGVGCGLAQVHIAGIEVGDVRLFEAGLGENQAVAGPNSDAAADERVPDLVALAVGKVIHIDARGQHHVRGSCI